jgi:hypothetical protein
MVLGARWEGIHQKVDIAGWRTSRLTVTEAAVGILPGQTSENRECRCQEVDRAGTQDEAERGLQGPREALGGLVAQGEGHLHPSCPRSMKVSAAKLVNVFVIDQTFTSLSPVQGVVRAVSRKLPPDVDDGPSRSTATEAPSSSPCRDRRRERQIVGVAALVSPVERPLVGLVERRADCRRGLNSPARRSCLGRGPCPAPHVRPRLPPAGTSPPPSPGGGRRRPGGRPRPTPRRRVRPRSKT